jgi:electron transport complex protein RnfG
MTIKYLTQAWLVIALALCFGAALAGVQLGLADRVERNKLDETMGKIPTLVPGAVRGEETLIGGKKLVYRAMDASGGQVGWVVPTAGQGFADQIELLIGLNNQATTITGLYVLSQKETPGLGEKITKANFCRRFKDKATGVPLEVIKVTNEDAPLPGNEIAAITGATVSSVSVTQIVNTTIAELAGQLAAVSQ